MEENNKSKSTSNINEKNTNDNSINENKNDNSEISGELTSINNNLENITNLIPALEQFNNKIESLKDISVIIDNNVFDILNKISQKDNIYINLQLSKIFMNILSNESLYDNYLLFEKSEGNKISLLLRLITEASNIIEKLNSFIYDRKLFELKKKIIEFAKCFYINCKLKIEDPIKLIKLTDLIEKLPSNFFSESYNEIMKDKNIIELFQEKSNNKISEFEEKYIEMNSYFEQYEIFQKFIESNIGKEDEKVNVQEENLEYTLDFYTNYGLLLLKFCKYHNYLFLNSRDEEATKKEKDDDYLPISTIFLVDKYKKLEENEQPENIGKMLEGKQYHSLIDSKNYNELIKKGLNYYIKWAKAFNVPKVKKIIEQMNYYIKTLSVESYVPLYLKSLSKISINDNFTPAFLTNVKAGKENKFYIRTNTEEKMIVFIEFFLEDTSKDISFSLNKYNLESNSFVKIYSETKVSDKHRIFIINSEKSLYEIIFDNSYSWLNSKDVSYRVSLLKLSNKEEIEKKEEQDEKTQFICNLNGKSFLFRFDQIAQKIEKYEEKQNIINIPVILHKKKLRFVVFDKNENNKEELKFKEILADEDDPFISKSFFHYQIINYLKKKKIKPQKNQKITVTIFSENVDLTATEDIEDDLKNEKDVNKIEFIKKIGFVPMENLEDYKVKYKLYDLCQQNLIYHLFLCKKKNIQNTKPILFLKFDKLSTMTFSILNKGLIINELKTEIKCEKNEYVFNLIKYVNDEYKGIDLVLSYIDCKEGEEKKSLFELFENIKKYCNEKLEPKIDVITYEQNDINIDIFKYMNLFYEN